MIFWAVVLGMFLLMAGHKILAAIVFFLTFLGWPQDDDKDHDKQQDENLK